MPANLPCPHCKTDLKLPPSFWKDRVAPWSCSYCGGLYGISNKFTAFAIPSNFRPLSPLLSQIVANRWCYYSHPCNYVYALCYPTGIPFYVGVGKAGRAMAHLTEATRVQNSNDPPTEKHVEINYLLTTELGVWYHFLCLTKDRNQAEQTEAFWIHYWDLRSQGGMLTNISYPESQPELDDPATPELPSEVEQDDFSILTFAHPDMAVCHPSSKHRQGDSIPLAAIECMACGSEVLADQHMHNKNLICPHCGHYVYGLDFRERFPLKQFADKEFLWTYRRKNT